MYIQLERGIQINVLSTSIFSIVWDFNQQKAPFLAMWASSLLAIIKDFKISEILLFQEQKLSFFLCSVNSKTKFTLKDKHITLQWLTLMVLWVFTLVGWKEFLLCDIHQDLLVLCLLFGVLRKWLSLTNVCKESLFLIKLLFVL